MEKWMRVAAVAVLLALAVALAMPSSTLAQSSVDGAIGVTVTDPSAASVPGANITVTSAATNARSSGSTDESGRTTIVRLTPGVYTVEVSATGFATYRQENVIVEVGRTTSITVALGLSGQIETVTASAETPVIVTERQDISTNINDVSITNLPINGRRWSNLVLSTPGAVADGGFGLVSFRGISGLLNNNTVDGGDNNQAFFAEEKGRTRISYSTSQAFIQEYQVNTSNFSAEYGRSAGGVVNAITKSGANEIHMDAFWYYRSSDFGAFNPFATVVPAPPAPSTPIPVKPVDKRHQFGGTIGGPIIKEKLFFFFGADQQLRNFPGVANASNPAAFFAPLSAGEMTTLTGRGISAAQASAGLAFLQGLTGVTPRKGDQTLLFPKIDWNINPNHRATFSYNRMRWASPAGIQTAGVVFRGRESFGSDFVKTDTVNARLNSVVTPTLLNEFRFTFGRDFEFQTSQPSLPGQPVSQQGVSPAIVIQGSTGITFGKPNFLDRRAFPDEKNYQFANTVSYSRGTHMMKFGFDINRVNDLQDNLFRESGEYTYTNRVQFISDYVAAVNNLAQPVCGTSPNFVPCYSSFNQGFGPTSFEFSTTDVGLFFQDDWRITPQLTLNLGVRWDYQQLPDPQFANSALPGSTEFPSDRNNFGPRLGAAWDVTGRGKYVVRGGYGIYYGRIINSTILNAITLTGAPGGQLAFQFLPSAANRPLYPNVVPTAPPPGASSPDVIVFPTDTGLPMIHQFDLAFEYQLARNTGLSVYYLSSLGRNLPRFVDTNLPTPTSTITYTVVGGPDDGAQFTMPLFTGVRPTAGFGRITEVSYSVKSKYNAMVFQFNRRMTNGLQVQAFYTYSKASDGGQGSQTFTSSNNVLNPLDLSLEEGRSNFDIPHRFTASAIWQPAYFQNSEKWVKVLLDGWTVAPIVSVSSGSVYTGGVSGNAPAGSGGTSTGLIGAGGSNRVLGIPRNTFRQSAIENVDLRIAKKFQLMESMTFELFGEAFNLFNHVNFTSVGTTQYSTAAVAPPPALPCTGNQCVGLLNFDTRFGVPTASSNFFITQRQIQIGAKFSF